MDVHPALGRIVAGAWAGRDADHWGVRYRELFREWAHDFLWALSVQVVAAVAPSRAHRDAMVVKEKQSAQPEVVAQVVADVLSAEDRLAQDEKKGVALWQQALRAGAVAPEEVVQERQREPQEQLARRVLPRPARLAKPMQAVVRLASQPAQ